MVKLESRGEGLREYMAERIECQIFDFAQLLAALLVSVDEMLICILQLVL